MATEPTASLSQQAEPPPPAASPDCPFDGASEKRRGVLEDQSCFFRTLAAFRAYRGHARAILERRKEDFDALSERHKQLLLPFDFSIHVYEPSLRCIDANADFLEEMCDAASTLHQAYWPQGPLKQEFSDHPTNMDMDKVYSTLRQFVRDWGDEGESERRTVYGLICATLERLFARIPQREAVMVLVPGAGLSRLSFDIAAMGFASFGNEFSYHMLIAGHFILNHVAESRKYRLFPFADSTLNLFSREDMFRPADIPQQSTYDRLSEIEAQGIPFGEFSMTAGDFVEVYTKPKEIGRWHAVVTCFFLDTAHNVVEYLEVIFNALAPGGYWINIGPLLYHYADQGDAESIELSFDEVMAVAMKIGFQFESPAALVESTYASSVRSMKQLVYRSAFCVARKPCIQAPPPPPPPPLQ